MSFICRKENAYPKETVKMLSLMGNGYSASDRKLEVYRRAVKKKPRYILGIIVGIVFIGLGIFSNEFVIFGGAIVLGISIVNLAACNYAEKQLLRMEAEAKSPRTSPEKKKTVNIEEKDCPHCGGRIPASSKFCEKCGKRQQ